MEISLLSTGNSEGSGKEGGRLGGNFPHNYLVRASLASQTHFCEKKGKDLVNCVYKPCLAVIVWSNHVAVFCHMMHYITV